jgi:glutaredoxin 3
MSHKIEIYSTPTCTFCVKVKNFLKEHDIEYTDYNVAEDKERLAEMVEKTGSMGVPVTIIDGGEPIVGWDKDALKAALDIKE